MEQTLPVLLFTALFIGATHTLLGPDHYLPFIVLGRAGSWTLGKTLRYTFLCGLGHVGSSVVIGTLGIALGWSLAGMEGFEEIRGNIAGYALMGFGGLYMVYGLFRERKGKPHGHMHVHADGSIHTHRHAHEAPAAHQHAHADAEEERPIAQPRRTRSFWAIFIIFVLGPCEPLIPLLMVPAAAHSPLGIAAVTAAFAVATIGVMLIVVWMGYLGLKTLRFDFLEKHIHTLSGAAILLSGLAIRLLGL